MPERGTEEIRKEIAAERQHLDDDLDGLRAELRSLVPFLVAGLVAVGLLTVHKGIKVSIRTIRKLS